jgi:hypothetical protein
MWCGTFSAMATPQEKPQSVLWLAEFISVTNTQRTFRQNLIFPQLEEKQVVFQQDGVYPHFSNFL